MKNIDFLPARYREQSALRKGKIWRICILLLFGLSVDAAALYQAAMLRSCHRRWAGLKPRLTAAQTDDANLARSSNELQALREVAQLYTYLRHPWPRTQILAQIIKPLPETVTLTEIRLSSETPSGPRGSEQWPGNPRNAAEEPGGDTGASPATADLLQLRQEFDQRQTIVRLTGTTASSADLHIYVGKLYQSPLFQEAELGTLESISRHNLEESQRADGLASNSTTQDEARFSLRLVVRSGYGQPAGPTRPASEVAMTNSPAKGEPLP